MLECSFDPGEIFDGGPYRFWASVNIGLGSDQGTSFERRRVLNAAGDQDGSVSAAAAALFISVSVSVMSSGQPAEQVEKVGRDTDIVRRTFSTWLASAESGTGARYRTAKQLLSSTQAFVPSTHILTPKQLSAFLLTESSGSPRIEVDKKISPYKFKIYLPGESKPDYNLTTISRYRLNTLQTKAADLAATVRAQQSVIEALRADAAAHAELKTQSHMEDNDTQLRGLLEAAKSTNAELTQRLGRYDAFERVCASVGENPSTGAIAGLKEHSAVMRHASAEYLTTAPGLHVREVSYLMALGATAVLSNLRLPVSSDVIAAVTPSRDFVVRSVRDAGSMQLDSVANELEGGCTGGGYYFSDHGNNGGKTSGSDLLVEGVVAWDLKVDKAIKRFADSAKTEKGGADVFGRSKQTKRRLGIKKFLGVGSDAAANMSKGFFAKAQAEWAKFIFLACWLHIMNLILMTAYYAGFGDEERGACSALRLAFMVPYLVDRCK